MPRNFFEQFTPPEPTPNFFEQFLEPEPEPNFFAQFVPPEPSAGVHLNRPTGAVNPYGATPSPGEPPPADVSDVFNRPTPEDYRPAHPIDYGNLVPRLGAWTGNVGNAFTRGVDDIREGFGRIIDPAGQRAREGAGHIQSLAPVEGEVGRGKAPGLTIDEALREKNRPLLTEEPKDDYRPGDDWRGRAAGVLQAGLGAFGTVYSPWAGTTKTLVGDPVNRFTGSETLGNAADALAGFVMPTVPGAASAGSLLARRGLIPAEGGVNRFARGLGTPLPGHAAGIAMKAAPVRDARDMITAILTPAEVSDASRGVAADLRSGYGTAARNERVLGQQLDAFATLDARLKADPARSNAFVDTIEAGQADRLPAPERAYAEYLRAQFADRDAKLATLGLPGYETRANYYPHAFERASRPGTTAPGTTEAGRGFLEPREYETQAEARAAGAVRKSFSPAVEVGEYVARADKVIAEENAFRHGLETGAVTFDRASATRDGYVAVPSRYHDGAYAAPDWARVYSNATMEAPGPKGSALGKLMALKNSATQMELGFSGYHALTMSHEAMMNEVARAAGLAATGRAPAALGALTFAPVAPLTLALRGAAVNRVYATRGARAGRTFAQKVLGNVAGRTVGDIAQVGSRMARVGSPPASRIADLLETSGGRIGGRHGTGELPGARYTGDELRAAGGSLKAAGNALPDQLALLKQRFADYGQRFAQAGLSDKAAMLANTAVKTGVGAVKTAVKSAPDAAVLAFQQVPRILSTISAPLFEGYIPLVKSGAFDATMSAWLRSNPTASKAAANAAARKIWDSMDNRFGEMVRDNHFWNKNLFFATQLVMRSPSWTIGAAKEIGGGIKDAAQGKSLSFRAGENYSPRMAYDIALPVVTGTINAVQQYLMTGEAPRDPMDLLAPRTGGDVYRKDKEGRVVKEPERLRPVGFAKEVVGAYEGVVEELGNKIAQPWSAIADIATNEDFRGKGFLPIDNPSQAGAQNISEYLAAMLEHIGEGVTPIAIKGVMTNPDGSKIPVWRKWLGEAPAGMKYTNPIGFEAMMNRKTFERTPKELRGGPIVVKPSSQEPTPVPMPMLGPARGATGKEVGATAYPTPLPAAARVLKPRKKRARAP